MNLDIFDGLLGSKKQSAPQIAPLPDYSEQLAADEAKASAEAAQRRRVGLREQLTIDLPEGDNVGTGLQIP